MTDPEGRRIARQLARIEREEERQCGCPVRDSRTCLRRKHPKVRFRLADRCRCRCHEGEDGAQEVNHDRTVS